MHAFKNGACHLIFACISSIIILGLDSPAQQDELPTNLLSTLSGAGSGNGGSGGTGGGGGGGGQPGSVSVSAIKATPKRKGFQIVDSAYFPEVRRGEERRR